MLGINNYYNSLCQAYNFIKHRNLCHTDKNELEIYNLKNKQTLAQYTIIIMIYK